MTKIDIKIKIEDEDFLPKYATDEAAGADLKAFIKEDIILKKGQSTLIPTGIFLYHYLKKILKKK